MQKCDHARPMYSSVGLVHAHLAHDEVLKILRYK